jgi:hypothetical protein
MAILHWYLELFDRRSLAKVDTSGIVWPCPEKSIPQVLNNALGIVMGQVALTSELIRAARALLRWEQRHLSEASAVSLPTVKRLESKPGTMVAHATTLAALKGAFESAGIEFINENGGGPGVRLRKRQRPKQPK